METSHASKAEERLSIGDAAKLVGVSVDTLRRWADAGHITAHQPIPGGHRRFRRGDVEALIGRAEESA